MLPEEKRIKSKQELKEWLSIESNKYGEKVGFLRKIFPILESDVLLKHQKLLRKTEYHINTGHKIRGKMYKILLMRLQNKYALHIPINTCSKGLKIMHVGSVLINRNSEVGQNCSFHINSALVAGGVNDKAPILGDGVVVGTGAVIVGDVNIADNVAVGANAVITKDVIEPDIAVAGVPAKKVSENGRSKWNQKAKMTK